MVNKNKIITVILVIVFIFAGYNFYHLSEHKTSPTNRVIPKVTYPPDYRIVFNKTFTVDGNETLGCIYIGESVNFTNIVCRTNVSGLLLIKSENKTSAAKEIENCIASCLTGKPGRNSGGGTGMVYSSPENYALSPRGYWRISANRVTEGFIHIVVCNYAGKSLFKYQSNVLDN